MVRFVESLGAGLIRFVTELGRIALFFLLACQALVRRPFRLRLLLDQFYFVANRSMFIVCVTGLFTGMVFTLQFYFGFSILDVDAFVGPASSLSLARELAPVFTAIVVTGRAGAAMAAQIGTMRITEQIDAMDVMAVDSIQYLATPRIFAGFLALPVLSLIFLFVGNVGSYLVAVHFLGIDPGLFFSHLGELVFVRDIVQGLIKAAVFGLMFATVGTFQGYYASGGASAVGQATNTAVVYTLVMILISDYFLTELIRGLIYPAGAFA